jgi:hypothetical protein
MSGPDPNGVPESRPWEKAGRWRRDVEPHRAHFLIALATVGRVCAISAWLVCLPGPVGFGLGVLVWALARRDLREMAAGRMDPLGRGLTRTAFEEGVFCAVISLLPLVGLCLLLCWARSWP